MVGFVSRRYMRGENRSLVVWLSQYLVFAATCREMALWSVLYNQYGKQNVEILELYVKIKKSKNELFKMSYILIYLATF